MTLRGPPGERSPAELLTFGVVNLDKPPGPSSHQVSGWLRDAVDETLAERGVESRIGRAAHAGTLDPKVTGCLPMMLGDATRLAQVFLEGERSTSPFSSVTRRFRPTPSRSSPSSRDRSIRSRRARAR